MYMSMETRQIKNWIPAIFAQKPCIWPFGIKNILSEHIISNRKQAG